MASPRRQRMANDDGPWKVSAVVSATMELFLSILLLLGAVIALITSQLVKHFDLEPPCTQIGCSHTIPPKFKKQRRTNNGREKFFFKLCPKRRSSLGFTKQRNEGSLHPTYDTDVSSVQKRADFSSEKSSASIIDRDTHHLDEKGYASSNHELVNISRHVKGIQTHKKFVKLTIGSSEGFHDAFEPAQFANEDCVSLMKSRCDCIFGRECNTGDCCEALPTYRANVWMNNLCHEERYCREALADEDSSKHLIRDRHYMLLKDKAENEVEDHDTLEAMVGCYTVNGHVVLKDEFKKSSEATVLHINREFPCDIESISKEKTHSSNSLHCNHRPSLTILKTAKTSICEDSDDCKESTSTNGHGGEHHYVLQGSDNKDMLEPKFLKKVDRDSVQPLLNSLLEDELEVPKISNMASNVGVLFDSPRSSGSEDGRYNELDELEIQEIGLEAGQHRYTLLDNDDKDSTDAPDFGNVLSDCVQPLLEGVQENELEAVRLSLNRMCTKTGASVGYITVKQFGDGSTNCQLSEETKIEAACLKGMINSNHLQAEALLPDFSSNHHDICPGVSGPLRHFGRDTMVEEYIESEDKCAFFADLESNSSLRKTEKDAAGEFLAGTEISHKTSLLEDLHCCGSLSLISQEAFMPETSETELRNQRKLLDDGATSFSDSSQRCQMLMGHYMSSREDIQAKNDNLLLEPQQQPVDTSVFRVDVEDHEQLFSVVAEIAQLEVDDSQPEECPEDSVNALRQALLTERTMLAALETELDNERNAAAIATSEAMAMISRLQEEKSAMQLQVAQLQRMAEEKAEYDEQAMAFLKEILFKREAEKHALEKELDLYRQTLQSEKEKYDKKGSSVRTSLPLPSKMEEDQDPFLLNDGDKSEEMSLPFPNEDQHTLPEENAQESSQKAAKILEQRNLKGTFQGDSRVVNDEKGSASLLIGTSGSSRSMFSMNGDETPFILERLWVLEEELRELREEDGLGGLKKSFEVHHLHCSPTRIKKSLKATDSCPGRQVGEHPDESGIAACLPVHDVYEVYSTPRQQAQYKDGVSFEEHEVPEDLKETETTKCGHSLQVIAYPGRPFPSSKSQDDIAITAGQIELSADNGRAILVKNTEDQLVTSDAMEQLAVRLQVLELDRDILKEASEYIRHKDLELNLLQEIAKHLRELRQVGFHSLFTGATPQDPLGPKYIKWHCSRAMKKRRYCSDPPMASRGSLAPAKKCFISQ